MSDDCQHPWYLAIISPIIPSCSIRRTICGPCSLYSERWIATCVPNWICRGFRYTENREHNSVSQRSRRSERYCSQRSEEIDQCQMVATPNKNQIRVNRSLLPFCIPLIRLGSLRSAIEKGYCGETLSGILISQSKCSTRAWACVSQIEILFAKTPIRSINDVLFAEIFGEKRKIIHSNKWSKS